MDLATFASSAVIAALIGPVASYFVIRRFRNDDEAELAVLREDLARETRRLDAERSILEARFQTQFSWLYQERARVMSEIYQYLLDAMDAFEDFAKSWGTLPGDTRTPKDKWLAARDKGEIFTNSFRKHRLLFPEHVADALSRVNRNFVGLFNGYFRELHISRGDEHAALLELFKKNELTLAPANEGLTIVENEFRRLYGTDHK